MGRLSSSAELYTPLIEMLKVYIPVLGVSKNASIPILAAFRLAEKLANYILKKIIFQAMSNEYCKIICNCICNCVC